MLRKATCKTHDVVKVVTSYQEENDFVDGHEDKTTRELGDDREECHWRFMDLGGVRDG